jgi:hypothetical protein
MRVSNGLCTLDVTVECRGNECRGEQITGSFLKYTVPETSDIKICIANAGETTIQLTALAKNTTWELPKGKSFNTVCSQLKGEDEIEFSGYLDLVLEFHH